MKRATKKLNLSSDTIRLLTTSDVGSVHGGVYEPLLPTSKRTCLSVDVPCTKPPVR